MMTGVHCGTTLEFLTILTDEKRNFTVRSHFIQVSKCLRHNIKLGSSSLEKFIKFCFGVNDNLYPQI